jgi:hypothetical protein
MENGCKGIYNWETKRNEKLLEDSRQDAMFPEVKAAVGKENRGQIFWEILGDHCEDFSWGPYDIRLIN